MSFAYRMLTNGVKFQKPEELDVFVTPEEAAEKALWMASRRSFMAGSRA